MLGCMNEDPFEITIESVAKFLEYNGGKCTNHELVSHFRKLLNDPHRKDDFRLQFKDIVNTIATVREDQGSKYICLKKQYFQHFYESSPEDPHIKSVDHHSQNYQPYWRYRLSFNANSLSPSPPITPTKSHHEENHSLPLNPLFHEHSRRRSMQDDIELNRNFLHDTFKSYSKNRSQTMFNTPSVVEVNNPNQLRRNSLMNENESVLSKISPLKAMSSTTSSLPESINNCSKSITSNNLSDPSYNIPHNYLRNKSPHKRPQPVCIPDVQFDPLLEKNHSLSQQNTNFQMVSLNNTAKDGIEPEPILLRSKELKEQSDSQELLRRQSLQEIKENCEVDEVRLQSGSVRERAQMIDTMAAAAAATTVPNVGASRRSTPRIAKSSRIDKVIPEDNASIVSLDSKLRRQWFICASKADYHGLVSLLKKEPRLAGIRDIASGFTALHWAAKHGNAEIIKLIAGTHKISPNLKSNGGYTCIHLATLYKHKAIVDLLLKTYGANPTIRDNSGKRADQYPENYVTFTVGVTRKPPKPAAVTAVSPSSLDRKKSMHHLQVNSDKNLRIKRRCSLRRSLHNSFSLKRPQTIIEDSNKSD